MAGSGVLEENAFALRWALHDRKLTFLQIRQLYDRHGSALVAYARVFLPDFSSAEDAVQSVFLRMLSGNVALPEYPAAYLYRAVKNAALNTNRSAKKEMPLSEEISWLVHQDGDRDATLLVESSLQELPEEQREVVILRIWSGMTLEEISQSLEVPSNTVASRYRYALEKLRKRILSEKNER